MLFCKATFSREKTNSVFMPLKRKNNKSIIINSKNQRLIYYKELYLYYIFRCFYEKRASLYFLYCIRVFREKYLRFSSSAVDCPKQSFLEKRLFHTIISGGGRSRFHARKNREKSVRGGWCNSHRDIHR